MVRQVQNSTDISTAQFFEHYSRLTKAYEKEGVSLQDRMIPYYMSDSFQRFKDLILNNEADFREYVVKPFIQPYVEYEYSEVSAALAAIMYLCNNFWKRNSCGLRQYVSITD